MKNRKLDVSCAVLDVEDVAHAVFELATRTDFHGQDYLLSSETYKVGEIHEMLNYREPAEHAQIVYKNDLAKWIWG